MTVAHLNSKIAKIHRFVIFVCTVSSLQCQ